MSQSLDIDGNGQYDALTDGLLVLRYLLGITGSTLTDRVVGAGAQRTTPAQIVEAARTQRGPGPGSRRANPRDARAPRHTK